MKIDYNQLFFRDTNKVKFLLLDNGKEYSGHIAGIVTQTFGGVSYELGMMGEDKKDIIESLKYEDVPEGTQTSDGESVTKVAQGNIEVTIPITRYHSIKLPGYISGLHMDDGLDADSGWFDCLLDEGMITEEEWDSIEPLQVSIVWEDCEKISKHKASGIFPKKDILTD